MKLYEQLESISLRVFLITTIVAVVLGTIMIWGEIRDRTAWKFLLTVLVVFLASGLMLNTIRSKLKEKA